MKKNIFTNILIFRPVMLFFLFFPPSIYALKQKSIESKTEKSNRNIIYTPAC